MTEYLLCIFVEVKMLATKQNNKLLAGVVHRLPHTNVKVFTQHILNKIQTLKAGEKHLYYG